MEKCCAGDIGPSGYHNYDRVILHNQSNPIFPYSCYKATHKSTKNIDKQYYINYTDKYSAQSNIFFIIKTALFKKDPTLKQAILLFNNCKYLRAWRTVQFHDL